MATPVKLTGKASYVSFNGANLMTITKYSPKVKRDQADTTDSANYDAVNDVVSPAQITHTVGIELSVEGNFDKANMPTAVLALLFTGGGPWAVILGLDAGTLFGHGNFDISDFECDSPIQDTVTYKATLKQNGAFTPNA